MTSRCMKKIFEKNHGMSNIFLILVFSSISNTAYTQAIRFVKCPNGEEYPRCIASDEICGYREKPTPPPNPNAGLIISAPCHYLPNGVQMKSCWIDGDHYCKAPSAADIARAEQEKREREERARREKLAAERKQAEIAHETQRLGSHREAEARRLVEMRERADAARRGNGMVPASNSLGTPAAGTPADKQCKTEQKRGQEGFGPGLPIETRKAAEERLLGDIRRACSQGGYTISGSMQCRSARVIGVISGKPFDSWGCTANYVCTEPVVKCPSKSGRGSAQ